MAANSKQDSSFVCKRKIKIYRFAIEYVQRIRD
jgi:hypothetical protein